MARNCSRKTLLKLNVLAVEIIQEVRILFCCILSQYWTKKQWSPLVQILIPSWRTLRFTLKLCAHMCVCVWNVVRNIFCLFCLLRNDMQSTDKNFITLCVCLQFLYEIVAVIWPCIACGIFLCPHSVSEDMSPACNIWLPAHSTLYSFAPC